VIVWKFIVECKESAQKWCFDGYGGYFKLDEFGRQILSVLVISSVDY